MNAILDEELANLMRALGHPVRLSILRILAERQNDCCCADVTDCLPVTQATVSQHIKVLLEAGLVERKPRGTRNYYSLNATRLEVFKGALSALNPGLAVEH